MRFSCDRPAMAAGLVVLFAALAWMAGNVVAGEGTPKEGDPAPSVDLPAYGIGTVLPNQKDAKTMKLDAFKGKKHVVLYFFPKALTGG